MGKYLHDATIAAGGTMLGQALIEPEGLALLGMEMEATQVVQAALAVEEAAGQEYNTICR